MKIKSIVVLGAGMVGVCSALALQKKGFQVTLVDKGKPGSETSFGNAGMITPSSLIPFNNPKLFAALPSFFSNKSIGFRYDLRYALTEVANLLKFLSFSTSKATDIRIQALFELIERSTQLHKDWLAISQNSGKLRKTGWLKLYRQGSRFANAKYELAIYDDYGIAVDLLGQDAVYNLEPGLKPIYTEGIHIKDALSVASPHEIVQQYLADFVSLGGELIESEVTGICRSGQGFVLNASQGSIATEQLVMTAGPWSKALLQDLQLNLPMIFERGGHRQFSFDDNNLIKTPIYDVEGGFVATPNPEGVRVTCGVELQHPLANKSHIQLDLVTRSAQQGLPIKGQYTSQWFGSRPSIPDSLPLIGESKIKGLWLNTGHQHIGFATGAGSADILVNLISAVPENLEKSFSPARFNL